MKKFGDQKLGIHGRDLPMFHKVSSLEDMKYWKMKNDYVEAPRYDSKLKMDQDRKDWAKNDILLLGDLSNE